LERRDRRENHDSQTIVILAVFLDSCVLVERGGGTSSLSLKRRKSEVLGGIFFFAFLMFLHQNAAKSENKHV
jgi:hypothetical protein